MGNKVAEIKTTAMGELHQVCDTPDVRLGTVIVFHSTDSANRRRDRRVAVIIA